VKPSQNGEPGDRFGDEFVATKVFADMFGLDTTEVEMRLRQNGVECRSGVLRENGSKFVGFRAVDGMDTFANEAKSAGWNKVNIP